MSLFGDLPAPDHAGHGQVKSEADDSGLKDKSEGDDFAPKNARHDKVALPKSALRTTKAGNAARETSVPESKDNAGRQVTFKSTESNVSGEAVTAALGKIAAHIANPAKFAKASNLAVQLLEAESISSNNAAQFFEVLRAAKSCVPAKVSDPGLLRDNQALFTAAKQRSKVFTITQQAELEVWLLSADLACDLQTDDSFQFTKATKRVQEAIEQLPDASSEEDADDVAGPGDVTAQPEAGPAAEPPPAGDATPAMAEPAPSAAAEDPFGLDALEEGPLVSRKVRKEVRAKRRREEEEAKQRDDMAARVLLRERRDALLHCLRRAASWYKHTWAQTAIDILAKHAFDHRHKFVGRQRDALEQLWLSVREQQVRRKQGKSAAGKLDVTSFESLQTHYAGEKMSIRKGLGSGGRSSEAWLG